MASSWHVLYMCISPSIKSCKSNEDVNDFILMRTSATAA